MKKNSIEHSYTGSQIAFFQENILKWFESNQRHFSWRRPSLTDYQIIISEILLQRTKAETVAKFYDKFLLTFPTWESLASANIEDIEKYLKPIGLYRQRASRLQKLAIHMLEQKGYLPTDRNQLEEISFMGQYIANAVELLVQKRNKPLLDVNMARVLERFFGPRKIADIRYDPYLQKLSELIVNHDKSKEMSWAILDFAALICKARKPLCEVCPISLYCLFFNQNKKNYL